ncbi:MAG TPA: TrkA family potassium uptake protein [Dehalococcoidales bacterium]|nr:TrkA family potassium uptake protein [Dehalococcoidales bacterium]
MKILIMGCGRTGSKLASLLDAEGHQVTILDTNENSFHRLPHDFKGTAIVGDGTVDEILEKAGIREMDAFVAVTQGDNRNIMAAQIAHHTFRVSKVLLRIYDPLRRELYTRLGFEAFSPTSIFAELLKDNLMRPS